MFDAVPSPASLWARCRAWKGLNDPEAERIAVQDYYDDASGEAPRYVNAAVAARLAPVDALRA